MIWLGLAFLILEGLDAFCVISFALRDVAWLSHFIIYEISQGEDVVSW